MCTYCAYDAITFTSDNLDVEGEIPTPNITRCLENEMVWETSTIIFKICKPTPLTSTKASAKLVPFDCNPVDLTEVDRKVD